MKQQALILLIVLVTSVFVNAQEKEVVVPYTLADRDRMVRIENPHGCTGNKDGCFGNKDGC